MRKSIFVMVSIVSLLGFFACGVDYVKTYCTEVATCEVNGTKIYPDVASCESTFNALFSVPLVGGASKTTFDNTAAKCVGKKGCEMNTCFSAASTTTTP